jgi:hypothetical protein
MKMENLLMGATESECRSLASTLPFAIPDENIFEWSSNNWVIVILFGNSDAERSEQTLLSVLPPGWKVDWIRGGMTEGSRAERCVVFKM